MRKIPATFKLMLSINSQRNKIYAAMSSNFSKLLKSGPLYMYLFVWHPLQTFQVEQCGFLHSQELQWWRPRGSMALLPVFKRLYFREELSSGYDLLLLRLILEFLFTEQVKIIKKKNRSSKDLRVCGLHSAMSGTDSRRSWSAHW